MWRSNLLRTGTLFCIGGAIYFAIEFIWKTFVSLNPIHWTMFLLGGTCFLLIGALNEKVLTWEMGLIKQSAIGAGLITVLEFIFGLILNVWLKLGIWDYSMLPLNILGQVCLPFSIIWFFLSAVAIVVDDVLRWKLFNEEKPHYHLKDHPICGNSPTDLPAK